MKLGFNKRTKKSTDVEQDAIKVQIKPGGLQIWRKKIFILTILCLVGLTVAYVVVSRKDSVLESIEKVDKESEERINAAAFNDDQLKSLLKLQSIQSLVANSKFEEAKVALDEFEKEFGINSVNESGFIAIANSICFKLADFDCIDRVLKYYEKENPAAYIVSNVEAGKIALSKENKELSIKYYLAALEKSDSLGGESYINDLKNKDKEGGFTLTYQEIKQGAGK
jgi:hypothetical protein